MSDNASWFYKDHLPEIAAKNNCTIAEAERLFMSGTHNKTKETKKKWSPVEVELEEPLLFRLMLMAHESDITLNQLVHKALEHQLKNNEYQFENGTKIGPEFLAED
jgi:predicted HicB family RNase H-like nuclease